MASSSFTDILDFWFGSPFASDRGRSRKAWFEKSAVFDTEIRDRFLLTWERAAKGELDSWRDTPLASMALVIVLDQFPRNMFRNEARAFSTDALALLVANRMLEAGFDRLLRPLERMFVYLPFEHAENIDAQKRSIALFDALAAAPLGLDNARWAKSHHDIVARFGRFPHRNAVLGRSSTPQELEFLKQPGSSF